MSAQPHGAPQRWTGEGPQQPRVVEPVVLRPVPRRPQPAAGRPAQGTGMDLRDYLRMLRRGWPVVLLVTVTFLGLATAYLVLAPKRYEAQTVLFVSAGAATGATDLQQGVQFATNAATTYGKVVDSPTVLGPAANDLRPRRDVDDLVEMVSTAVPEGTTLIDLVVSAGDPADAAAVADAAAAAATRVLPTLEDAGASPSPVRVRQIQQATEPAEPVSPDTSQTLAIGLVAGLCVGLGLTIALQSLDTRIRRPEDVRASTDVPLLATLPQLTEQGWLAGRLGRGSPASLAVRDELSGPAGEAFRTLRTNLRFLEGTERRSVVFTPVDDEVDHAHLPANLAWSLAQAGRRVLLVDLDLRRAGIGEVLGLRADRGMAEVLSGRADLPAVTLATRHPRLHAVLAGDTLHSPSDLLSSPILAGVLRRMEREHDYVILHCPPLLACSDAAVVSEVAGGTLVSLTAGRTRGQELATALQTLDNVGVSPVGLVLTGAGRRKGAGRRPAGAPVPEPVPQPRPRPRPHPRPVRPEVR